MDPKESQLREEMIDFANRLAARGLIRGSNGNISTRLGDRRFLITPTQQPKGYLREADIVLIDAEGGNLDGKQIASMDTEFHLAAYQARPDAQAVVHAHPIITTAFSLAGKLMENGLLPEFDYLFPKGVPIVPYRAQATQEYSEICQEFFANHDIVILSHHGTLALGNSLMQAWMLTEHLETCYEVSFYSECLKKTNPLSENQINLLHEVNKRNKTY